MTSLVPRVDDVCSTAVLEAAVEAGRYRIRHRRVVRPWEIVRMAYTVSVTPRPQCLVPVENFLGAGPRLKLRLGRRENERRGVPAFVHERAGACKFFKSEPLHKSEREVAGGQNADLLRERRPP